MPGVVVTTGVRTGPSTTAVAPASTFFVVGTAVRGPVDEAKLVTSLADFEAFYGGYNASYTLHQHLQTYFEEGGVRAYVSRTVGASATSGTRTLNDSGAAASLRIDAANPGAWSTGVTVSVINASSVATVKIYFDGTLVYSTGAQSTVAALVDKINNDSDASIYVTATALATNLPATVTDQALSAGNNGSAPTTAQLLGTSTTTGLALFDESLGAGAVAIPGQTTTTAYDGIIDHAVAYNRIALLAIASGDTVAEAVTTVENYGTYTGAEYAAFYYPHITISGEGGISLTISPESYVAAKRAVAHSQVGPWQAYAGLISQAKFVTGLETTVSRSDGDTLDAGRVNALRLIQGTVRVYGARSASDDEDNYRFITYRDVLNYIVTEAEKRLEDLVFSPIDGRQTVFGRVESRLVGLLDPIRSAGGLYEAFNADGELIDPGYSVVVNDALNPVTQLATGLIKARVGVRVSSVGDTIEVEVLKSNLTSSVV